MTLTRLQKYLSSCGICSRRHAEEAIEKGEVLVNGIPAIIGQSIDPDVDKVTFAGQMVERSTGLVYYALHKPRGIESTNASRGGESIVDIVDISTRVFPIGRLDKDSSGLILLTNDGRITHRLLHPSFEHEKEYLVTTYGKIDDLSLEQMRRGVRYVIEDQSEKGKVNHRQGGTGSEKGRNFVSSSRASDPARGGVRDTGSRTSTRRSLPYLGNKSSALRQARGTFQPSADKLFKKEVGKTKFIQTQPCEVFRVSSDTFRIILKEGKNRQIRRMVQACGHEVKKLKRIRIEHIELRDLPEGAYRELKRGEREELLRRAALPLVDFSPLVGEVVHGDGRGKGIGFPTANIATPPSAPPSSRGEVRTSGQGGAESASVRGEVRTSGQGGAESASVRGDVRVSGQEGVAETPPSRNEGGGGTIVKSGGVLPDATFSCRVKIGDEVYLGAGTYNPKKMCIQNPLLEGREVMQYKNRGILSSVNPQSSTSSDSSFQKEHTGTFEVHILDFDQDIYGQTIHVDIMDIIRQNASFPDVTQLTDQIKKDIHHVRAHWQSILK